MVEHILLMRWKDEASQGAIDNALAELRGLKSKIAGIVDLSCGVNFTERAKGYTHALVIRFADRPSLEAYFPHPEHRRVVQSVINPIRADTLILDYEI